jgi:hypothetical protein
VFVCTFGFFFFISVTWERVGRERRKVLCSSDKMQQQQQQSG